MMRGMSDTITPAEMTLDELREAAAPLIAANVVFDGWTERAMAAAAERLGVPASRLKLAFPGGAVEMIDAWFQWMDRKLAERFPAERLAPLKIRERIRTLVLGRLAVADKEASRRALAVLAMPGNIARAAKLSWRAADVLWRLAGDSETGFAHYTKRATLAGVYGATLMIWLNDESEGEAETAAFLDRRIEDVMRFERAKARLKPDPDRHFQPALFLGRLRYPEA